jgi:hypothetical protein
VAEAVVRVSTVLVALAVTAAVLALWARLRVRTLALVAVAQDRVPAIGPVELAVLGM